VAVLREHWKAQQEQRLFLGLGKAGDDALVFSSWDGSPYLPHTLTQQCKAMKAAGLTAALHSLRHTHASTLIAAGLDVLTIGRRLGHGTPALTLGVTSTCSRPIIVPLRSWRRPSRLKGRDECATCDTV
jgi:integrase